MSFTITSIIAWLFELPISLLSSCLCFSSMSRLFLKNGMSVDNLDIVPLFKGITFASNAERLNFTGAFLAPLIQERSNPSFFWFGKSISPKYGALSCDLIVQYVANAWLFTKSVILAIIYLLLLQIQF